MRVLTVKRCPRRVPIPWWAFAVTGIWLGLVGVYELVKTDHGPDATLCHLRRFTGVPCPTCGTTRMVLSAGRGEIGAAFLHNPFIFSASLLGAGWLLLRVGFGRSVALNISRDRAAWLWAAIAVLFFANWAYVIWRDLHVGDAA